MLDLLADSCSSTYLGMFLHAKLVFQVVKDYGTLPQIQAEVENLPDGLNQA